MTRPVRVEEREAPARAKRRRRRGQQSGCRDGCRYSAPFRPEGARLTYRVCRGCGSTVLAGPGS